MNRRQYKTAQECAALGWLTKTQLLEKRLKPAPLQQPVDRYWQGHGWVNVYSTDCALPMRPRNAPTPAQLAALAGGRSRVGVPEAVRRHTQVRREAEATARAWLAADPLYLDTETTGLDAGAQVLELALMSGDGKFLIDTLVQTTVQMDPQASAIHGITSADLLEAPEWSDVSVELARLAAGRPIVIYNADFDVRLLQQTSRAHGLGSPPIDARCLMQLYASWHGEWNEYRGNWRWKKLSDAAAQAGYFDDRMHRAAADCRASRSVLEYLASC